MARLHMAKMQLSHNALGLDDVRIHIRAAELAHEWINLLRTHARCMLTHADIPEVVPKRQHGQRASVKRHDRLRRLEVCPLWDCANFVTYRRHFRRNVGGFQTSHATPGPMQRTRS